MIHVLRVPEIARPWWRTDERASSYTGRTVITDCCSCRMAASETDCRIVSSWEPPHGDFGCYQEQPNLKADASLPTGAYYEPRLEIRCAHGFGCDANPKRRWGRALREHMRDPA